MFLDAALGLYLWGGIFLGVLSLLVLVSVFALSYAVRVWRAGRKKLAWALAIPAAAVLSSITAGGVSVLLDHRPDRNVLMDLRTPRAEMLQNLARSCAAKPDDDHCDSSRYALRATVILPDGVKFAVTASDIRWFPSQEKAFAYISVMGSNPMTLDAARVSLKDHVVLFSTEAGPQTQEKIKSTQEWLSKPNGQKVYSEVHSVELRPYFAMIFRKNVDRVAIDYSITPLY
jgi:hypothetical protein